MLVDRNSARFARKVVDVSSKRDVVVKHATHKRLFPRLLDDVLGDKRSPAGNAGAIQLSLQRGSVKLSGKGIEQLTLCFFFRQQLPALACGFLKTFGQEHHLLA